MAQKDVDEQYLKEIREKMFGRKPAQEIADDEVAVDDADVVLDEEPQSNPEFEQRYRIEQSSKPKALKALDEVGAAGQGAADVVTFGWQPEIQAASMKAARLLGAEEGLPWKEWDFSKEADYQRYAAARGAEESPIASGIGTGAGVLASIFGGGAGTAKLLGNMGKAKGVLPILARIGTGAGVGAIESAAVNPKSIGGEEYFDPEGMAERAGSGAKWGAGGGALGELMQGIAAIRSGGGAKTHADRLLGESTKPGKKKVEKLTGLLGIEDASDALGESGAILQKYTPEYKSSLLSVDEYKKARNAGESFLPSLKKAAKAEVSNTWDNLRPRTNKVIRSQINNAKEVIGRSMDDIERAAGNKITISRSNLKKDMLKDLTMEKMTKKMGLTYDQASTLLDKVDEVFYGLEESITPSELRVIKTAFQDALFEGKDLVNTESMSALNKAKNLAQRAFGDSVEKAVTESMGGDAGKQYNKLLRDYSAIATMGEAAKDLNISSAVEGAKKALPLLPGAVGLGGYFALEKVDKDLANSYANILGPIAAYSMLPAGARSSLLRANAPAYAAQLPRFFQDASPEEISDEDVMFDDRAPQSMSPADMEALKRIAEEPRQSFEDYGRIPLEDYGRQSMDKVPMERMPLDEYKALQRGDIEAYLKKKKEKK